MKLSTFDEGLVHLKYLILYPKKDNSYVIVDKLNVNYSSSSECNIDYCQQNLIPTTFLERLGSTFVLNKGDFVFLHCNQEDNFINKWEFFLQKKLLQYNLTLTYEHNDFLINDKKVMGSFGQKLQDNYFLSVICMSIKDSGELVKNICLKSINKVPGSWEEYNISTDTIEKWYLEFIFYFK